MNRTIINGYLKILILLCSGAGTFGIQTATGQIRLKDERIALENQQFFIAQVGDESVKKDAVAELAIRNPDNTIQVPASNLEGGPAIAIGKYFERNLPIDKSLWPVIVQIKELKITESVSAAGRIDGQITLTLSFGLERAYGFEHLIDFPGKLRYVRSEANTASVERNLRSILKAGLVYLNGWLIENGKTSIKLTKAVNISFSDYTEQPENDTIYYSVKRPLTWADFQSKLRPTGPYQASVMPSIAYTEQAKVVNGTVEIKILMKAYVPKSTCWANPTGRDDYALNHEQRHFDIVKIIAEQFKRKILAKKLKPDNYEAEINMQYLDSFRDMDGMQKDYDAETGHGQNKLAQENWNSLVDKELKLLSQ